MFGHKQKNTPGPETGNLIYADTMASEPLNQPEPGRKRRRYIRLLILGAVLILAAAAVTLRLREENRQARYDQAAALLDMKEYEDAAAAFEALGNYRDAQDRAARLTEQRSAYEAAAALVEQQRYDEATAAYRALGDYADSAELAAYGVTYRMALDLIVEIDVGKTGLLTRILAEQVRLTDENSYPTTVGYEAAAALLESLGDYKSAPALVDRCYYSAGLVKLGWKDWEGALAYTKKMTPETAAEFYEEYEQRYTEFTEAEG